MFIPYFNLHQLVIFCEASNFITNSQETFFDSCLKSLYVGDLTKILIFLNQESFFVF